MPSALRTVVAAIVAVAVVFVAPPAALAGGSWFAPVQDRYEAGDQVTLIGFTGGGSQGWIEDGPFFGYLVGTDEAGNPSVDGERFLSTGELDLVDSGNPGYLRLRASVSFVLPDDFPPGVYGFDYCNQACDERLGDLIGGTVYVGADPPALLTREWPLDDPEVANLAPGAVLTGPGFSTRADEVREGWITQTDDGSTATPEDSMTSTDSTSTVATTVAPSAAAPQSTEVTEVAVASASPDAGGDDDGNSAGMVLLLVPLVLVFGVVVFFRRTGWPKRSMSTPTRAKSRR